MKRGFTLLEMMITMAIFILLSAAVFGVVSGVIQAASTLQDNQNRTDQLVALQAYLKGKLEALPAQSTLVSFQRGDGEGLVQNGIILGIQDGSTGIDAKIQPNGYYTLRLATLTRKPTDNLAAWKQIEQAMDDDDSALNWVPLIHDVQRIDWKFQDTNTKQWIDRWNNPAAKPAMVECSLKLAGDAQATTMDFWLPPIAGGPPAFTSPAQ